MKISRTFCACLLLSLFAFLARGYGRSSSQAGSTSSNAVGDPLEQITSTFPQSIRLNQSKRILEFCPDFDTCDGFMASQDVSVATLKDFAYLYIYFFSDYFDLPRWRERPESRATAERILSKPEYHNCKRKSDFEAARCVLLGQKDAIRLEFVRYDEGKRNAAPEDLVKQLSEKKPAPKR